jgi:hypothetical protein
MPREDHLTAENKKNGLHFCRPFFWQQPPEAGHELAAFVSQASA